jgi:ElaB/YqjD/DUF883 family membrane-anchored ribosome-binding protein
MRWLMDEEIIDNLNERLDETIERGRKLIEEDDLGEEISVQLEDIQYKLEQAIREHPLRSIGIGLLAGYIIGKLFSSD